MSPDKQAADALIGTVFEGAYRIEGILGEGGMGAVYAATHLRLAKRVAVKVMARELASNTDALARFHREAVVTGGLGHPHIVQVFDFSTTPTGEPFLVMEFLEGEDLDHRLRRAGRLPAAQVVHIVKQVASALAATHAKTIVHRDLKPANIYLLEVAGETDFVKVLDFGISKVRAATTKLTQATSVMGTPNYMSPEQAMGRVDEIDERTDQWALACIAWECLSGAGPFVGENVPSILFQVVHEPPSALVAKVAGLRPQVEEVLLHALAKDKNDRFASVSDFALALEGAVAGSVTVSQASVARIAQSPSVAGAKTTTFTQSTGEISDNHDDDDDLDVPPSRPKWHLALAVGAAVMLLVGGILLFRPGATPTPTVSSPAAAVVEPPRPVPPPPSPPSQPREAPPAANPAEPEPPSAKPAEPVASPPKAKRSTVKTSLPDPFERNAPSRAAKAQPAKVAHPSHLPLNDEL
jgi:serine/threonine-protein kinase